MVKPHTNIYGKVKSYIKAHIKLNKAFDINLDMAIDIVNHHMAKLTIKRIEETIKCRKRRINMVEHGGSLNLTSLG